MSVEHISQVSMLIIRMLDELVAQIITVYENEDMDNVVKSIEGEFIDEKLEFLEEKYDPYKTLNIRDFLVNMGSYVAMLIREHGLVNIAEYAVLVDYLTDNVDNIHYAGSVISAIENDKRQNEDLQNDFL